MGDLTRHGLKYRFVGNNPRLGGLRYACRRCDLVVKAQHGPAGWTHVCVPRPDDITKIDPDASTEEQYEALSLAYADVAAKVRRWNSYGDPDSGVIEHARKAELAAKEQG